MRDEDECNKEVKVYELVFRDDYGYPKSAQINLTYTRA